MYRILFLMSVLLLGLPGTGNAQGLLPKDSIRLYYQFMHKAEHLAINQEYELAVLNYNSGFMYKQPPFAVDIQNYLTCNLLQKSYSKVLSAAYSLIKKGAPLAYFEKALFADFNNSEEGLVLRKNYPKIHELYEKTVNREIIAILKKMADADQAVHCALPVKTGDIAFIKEMHQNDDSLALILNDLLMKNDFLSEEIIGANFQSDSILLINPLYGGVALHQMQKGGVLLKQSISLAIQSGKLRAEIGVGWMSLAHNPPISLTRLYQVYADTLWKRKETDWEQRMFRRFSGQSVDRTRKLMHDYYLDDSYFDVEERVVYNFYTICKTCTLSIKPSFYILPSATMVEANTAESKVQMNAYFHSDFFAFAFSMR